METYKSGQGGLARLSAALALSLAAGLGAIELYANIQARDDRSLVPGQVFESLPLLGVPLSWKLLLCLALFLAMLYGIRKYLTRPTVVDTLIETESEMNKVSWPSRQETQRASLVVVLVSVLLCGVLAVFDWVLNLALELIF